MMKLSQKSSYAVRALIDLAHSAQKGPERLAAIAVREKIPLPFLEQIFLKLKNAGVVQAIRGPQGGYQLSRQPDEISLETIVTILEGPLEPVLCSQPEHRSSQCHDVDGCLSRTICHELDGAVSQVLGRTTLAKMLAEESRVKKEKI